MIIEIGKFINGDYEIDLMDKQDMENENKINLTKEQIVDKLQLISYALSDDRNRFNILKLVNDLIKEILQ